MANLKQLQENTSEDLPKNSVVFLSGPMKDCKSSPDLETPDNNVAQFNAMEAFFQEKGYDVINPARTATKFSEELGLPIDSPEVQQAAFKTDLKALASAGPVDVVLVPPAYTVDSTPEEPQLKTWEQSKASNMEMAIAHRSGAEFGQAVEKEDGSYSVTPIPREEMAMALNGSKTLAGIQEQFSAGRKGSESVGEETVSAKAHVMPTHDESESESVSIK